MFEIRTLLWGPTAVQKCVGSHGGVARFKAKMLGQNALIHVSGELVDTYCFSSVQKVLLIRPFCSCKAKLALARLALFGRFSPRSGSVPAWDLRPLGDFAVPDAGEGLTEDMAYV